MDKARLDSPLFWRDFSDRLWGREPIALRGFCAPPLTSEELYRLVVSCCDPTSAACGVRVQLFIDGKDRAGHLSGEHLPRADDASFESFDRRMKTLLDGADYFFFIRYPEALHFPLWDWSRRFLARLYEHVGMDTLGAYQSIFFGDYRKTPFGVHCDHEDIFQIPILGRKVLRCWHGDYAAGRPRFAGTLDLREFAADSFVLEGWPGDILYWPSQIWHVAESPGGLTASLSLGLCRSDHDIPLAQRLLEEVTNARWDELRAAPGPKRCAPLPFEPSRPQRSVQAVPAPLSEAARRIGSWLDDRQVASRWLRLVTGGSFLRVPQPRDGESITMADTVRRLADNPMAWIPTGNGQLEVSVNGLSAIAPADPRIERLLERLEVGGSTSVTALLSPLAERGDSDSVSLTAAACALLTELWQFRGIERVGPEPRTTEADRAVVKRRG
jgi:hypothetical protein